jgi:type I restriction enzyme S subunit
MKDIYMSDVSEQIRGVSYKPHDVLSDPCDNAIGLLRANNICDGNININDLVYVRKECVSDKQLLRKGDILLCASSGSKNLVGKAAQIEKDSKYGFGAFCKVVRPKHIDPLYLGMFFQSNLYRQYISQASQGANINNIRNEDIATIRLKYHTEQEQKEIAKKLFNVRNIISKNKEVLNNLDNLTKSRFIEIFGDPVLNTKKLKIVHLSEIAEYFNGLTYKPTDVNSNGTLVLRSSNIQHSRLDFTNVVHVGCSIKDRLYVKNNDILMCSRNGSAKLVGKVALIKNLQEPMTFGAFMMIIRSIYADYLLMYFQMDAFRRQIITGATTTINQITGTMLDKIVLPVPDKQSLEKYITFIQENDKLKLFPR